MLVTWSFTPQLHHDSSIMDSFPVNQENVRSYFLCLSQAKVKQVCLFDTLPQNIRRVLYHFTHKKSERKVSIMKLTNYAYPLFFTQGHLHNVSVCDMIGKKALMNKATKIYIFLIKQELLSRLSQGCNISNMSNTRPPPPLLYVLRCCLCPTDF